MAGYILDTTALSALLDPAHRRHRAMARAIPQLTQDSTVYLSPIVLAEIEFGVRMARAFGNVRLPALERMLAKAQRSGELLGISHHTAAAYAELKTNLATAYLANASRKKRPRWIEDWVDRTTGKKLQIDENDLWICAQAKERALTVVTSDRRMRRIADADAEVSLEVL